MYRHNENVNKSQTFYRSISLSIYHISHIYDVKLKLSKHKADYCC